MGLRSRPLTNQNLDAMSMRDAHWGAHEARCRPGAERSRRIPAVNNDSKVDGMADTVTAMPVHVDQLCWCGERSLDHGEHHHLRLQR